LNIILNSLQGWGAASVRILLTAGSSMPAQAGDGVTHHIRRAYEGGLHGDVAFPSVGSDTMYKSMAGPNRAPAVSRRFVPHFLNGRTLS
jgi:hypothetical protein